MKIVINTISTKRLSGGAFQIAINFIKTSLQYADSEIEWIYWVSSDLDEAIGDEIKRQDSKNYYVFPTQPDFLGSYRTVKYKIKELERNIQPDLIYTISSPCYFSFETTEVMRFANAWVTNPNRLAWKSLGSFKSKLRFYFYCILQRYLLKRGKFFVTQSTTVQKGLERISHAGLDNIKVVPNVLPATYKNCSIEKFLHGDVVNIISVSSTAAHKNLSIIPFVARELKNARLKFQFHLTLPADSDVWHKVALESEKLGVADFIVNHGVCSQSALAELYRSMDICFFPSLLETFSATLLEALYFNLYTVASDMDFNHEIMQDAALYFEPTDCETAASQIIKIVGDDSLKKLLKQRMQQRLSIYGDYNEHFNEIVKFLKIVHEKTV